MPEDARDYYSELYQKTMKKNIPFVGQWELNTNCNLNCYHCYLGRQRQCYGLPLVKIKSILDELADLGTLYLSFTGGEILLRKDFFEIAGYSRKKNFAIRLLTNATLIDEDAADKINALNPLSVDVSLYALNPVIHDRITGMIGSQELVIRAIKLLRKREIKVVVKTLFMKENLAEFNPIKYFCQDNGVEFQFDFTMTPADDGSIDVSRLGLEKSQIEDVFSENNILVSRRQDASLDALLCAAGINSFFISSSGNLYPCIFLKKNMGSLLRERFQEIWNSSNFNNFRAIDAQDFYNCRQCGLVGYCNHCMGLSLLEHGNLLGASSLDCRLALVFKNVYEKRRSKYGEEKEELSETSSHL
ncbi:MAG: radical SAM protein [Candidatus Omnitrophica bacterium]|nr:radical SAM protein [Candidatus Omnitrophota bacterium]